MGEYDAPRSPYIILIKAMHDARGMGQAIHGPVVGEGYSGGIRGVFQGYSGGIRGVFKGYSGPKKGIQDCAAA